MAKKRKDRKVPSIPTVPPDPSLRTPEEIVQRIKQKSQNPVDFEPEVLLPYLDFKAAKPLLNDTATAKEWNDLKSPYTRDFVLAEAKKYMAEYGWPKCQDHRGISAGRTIDKMLAWAWLLCEDDLIRKIKNASYQNYGAPKLRVICEHFDWPIPDDGATQRMTEGKSCCDDCQEGCGA